MGLFSVASAVTEPFAAASSTVIQPSAVHTGLCEDPEETLEHLFVTLVLPEHGR